MIANNFTPIPEPQGDERWYYLLAAALLALTILLTV